VINRNAEHATAPLRFSMNRTHAVFEQNLDTRFARRGFQRADQARAGPDFWVVWIGRLAGMDHRPIGDVDLHRARHRDADLVANIVRRPVDDFHSVGEQEFERRHAIVDKSADNLAIVVAIRREAVVLDHRPIGQMAEEKLGRILDAVFFLIMGAAAERQVAAAGDSVTADMRLCLDDDDRGASLAGDDRRWHPGGARADHDDVSLAVPMERRFIHRYDLS
jgi:hypothetical protein